jgi:broad-specificity NMP kinase
MARMPVPVLWITGPPGVGKSTVSWRLFADLAASGTRTASCTAFADADQLCMCYPAPSDDPGRDVIRARNAGILIRNFQAAGVRRVIINGYVDPGLGVRRDLLASATVLVCRLRADPADLVRRFTGRQPRIDGDLEDLLIQTQGEADRMDASAFADVCVDTTGVPAGEVARLVRDRCRDWPGFGVADEQPAAPACARPAASAAWAVSQAPGSGGRILLLCGPAGVGKSTIGFRLYQRCLGAGRTAGYIDLDQIGFLRPRPEGDPLGHELKARNLAGIWPVYRAAGASHLVATGPVESQDALRVYQAALPGAVITVCRLHARPEELSQRIMTRGQGGSWPQPGDPLRGRPASYLSWFAGQAAAHARALEDAGLDALRVDTTGRTVGEAADLIAAATGWPG